MRMACRILTCVVLFNVVVAVPLKNDDITIAVTEHANLRMASPSYIRSIENFNRDSPLERSMYNVPIPTNLNPNYQEYVSPREAGVSEVHASDYKNNQGILKELQLSPNHEAPQSVPTKLQTRFSENPYQNINTNREISPILKEVIDALRKQNVNREPAPLEKPDQPLQRWPQLHEGSSTLQNILSNPILLQNILAPRPKVKQYTVVYPNGTIGYEDNLDIIANRYPNHFLINARDIQELSSANSETRLDINQQQDNSKNTVSKSPTDFSNNIDKNPTADLIGQNSHSKLEKSDLQLFDSSTYTTAFDQLNKKSNLQTPDNAPIKSIISMSPEINSPLNTKTGRYEDTNSIHSSNNTQYLTPKITQNLQKPNDTIIKLEQNSKNQELQEKNQDTNQSEQFDDTKNINSIILENLSSSNQTNDTELSTDTEWEEKYNNPSVIAVNDKVKNNTTNLDKAENSTLNKTSDTHILISTERIKDLGTILQNNTSTSDSEIDNLNNNSTNASNKNNNPSVSAVSDKVRNNTTSLDKAENSTLNKTSDSHILFSTERINDLGTVLQNNTSTSDSEIDNLYNNATNATNMTTTDSYSNVNDIENTTTELPRNMNTNNNLTHDFIPPSTINTNITSKTLFNDTFCNGTGTDKLFELKNNETNDANDANTDMDSLSDSFDDGFQNNGGSQDGLWVHSEVFEDNETNGKDDVSSKSEVDYNKSTPWVKTDKENIANMLFGKGNENPNVYFMFYNPPEVEVEKETKTIVYPNGTIVEEYIETMKDLDGGPTIKTIIIKTYNVGVDSTSDCNCTRNNR